MRTTLDIDDDLFEQAREFSGLPKKTAIVHEALRALIQREAARALADAGGQHPDLGEIPRRRSLPAK